MARFGIVTCEKILPYAQSQESHLYTRDDILLFDELRRRGHAIDPLIWGDTLPTRGSLDMVLQRSPWDYMRDQRAYLDWIQAIVQAGIPVENSYEITAWNIDKHYLRDMKERGVCTVPTIYHEPSSTALLREVMEKQGWSEMVIKPAVSAAARDTFRLNQQEAEAFQSRFDSLQQGRVFMLQPFVQEVLTEGEWSLVFVEGEYTHAVRKRAKEGDYRVQDDHGGAVFFDSPSEALVAQAQRAVTAIPESLLYARVDGIEVNGEFWLVELELIEPELFLRAEPNAVRKMADAIEARLD